MKTKRFLVVGWVMLLALSARAQTGEIESLLDPAFAPTGKGNLSAIGVQADGKLLVARNDYSAGRRVSITRRNSDGSEDATFSELQGAGHAHGCGPVIRAIVPTESGIFVGGDFTSLNEVSRPLIAKLNSDGVVDENFRSDLVRGPAGCQAGVRSIVVQNDGKLIVAGNFYTGPADNSPAKFARLNADGSLDSTFTLSPDFLPRGVTMNSIALQPDGKLIVAGQFGAVNGSIRHSIVRLNVDGTVDQSFQPDVAASWTANGWIAAALIQPDGRILLGGSFQSVNGFRRDGLARLKQDGTLDSSFYPGEASYADIESLALQADGKVLASGQADWNGQAVSSLFRLRAGLTNRWVSFSRTNYIASESQPIANVTVERIGNPDGTITVDYFTTPATAVPGSDYQAQSGTLTFASGEASKEIGIPLLDDASAEPDETVLLSLANPSTNALFRRDSTAVLRILDEERPGCIDLSFSRAGEIAIGGEALGNPFFASPLIVQSDSKFWVVEWGFDVRLGARLQADGSADPTFTPDPSFGSVAAIGVQSDGGAIVWCGLESEALIKVKIDGSIDPSFKAFVPPEECCPWARMGAVQPDDKIVTVVSGATLIRYEKNGEIDASFKRAEISVDELLIRALTIQPDGKIVLGGYGANASEGPLLHRFLPNGDLDTSFNPPITTDTNLFFPNRSCCGPFEGAHIQSILVQPDGKLILAGKFAVESEFSWLNLVRLNQDGSLDRSFRRAVPTNEVNAQVLLQHDGRIIVANHVWEADHYKFTLSRLNTDGSIDSSFEPVSAVGTVQQIAFQSEGKLLIAGNFNEINGVQRQSLARFNLQPRLMFESLTQPRGGKLSLSVTTEPAKDYLLEASTNLRDWLPLWTNTASAFTVDFEDRDAATFPKRFYRARVR